MSVCLTLGLFSVSEWNKQHSTFLLLWWAEFLMSGLGLITGLTKSWKYILVKCRKFLAWLDWEIFLFKIQCHGAARQIPLSLSVSSTVGQQHDVPLLPCCFRAEKKAVICCGPFRKSARFSLCCNTRWGEVNPQDPKHSRGSSARMHMTSQRAKREFLSAPSPFQWWPKPAPLQPELSWQFLVR